MAQGFILIIFLSSLFILQSYPRPQELFNTTPQPIKSNFTCIGKTTGYYADVPSNCRVYHNCDDQGNKFSYHCPEMTAFRQEALICDHAHLVDCQTGTKIDKKITTTQDTIAFDQSHQPTTTKISERSFIVAKQFQSYFYTRKNTSNPFLSSKFLHTSNFGADNTSGRNSGRQTSQDYSTFRENSSNPFFNTNFIKNSNFRNDNGSGQDASRHIFGNNFSPRNNSSNPFFSSNFPDNSNFGNDRSSAGQNKSQLTNFGWNMRQPSFEQNRTKFFGNGFIDTPRKSDSEIGNGRGIENGEKYSKSRETIETTTKSYLNLNNKNINNPEADVGRNERAENSSMPLSALNIGDISYRDLSASLIPLVPNPLEFDPYYPRESWSTTEIYYTSSESNELPRALVAPNFEPPGSDDVNFEVPDTWPDLNTIEDIIDRRKLFYIPKMKKNL